MNYHRRDLIRFFDCNGEIKEGLVVVKTEIDGESGCIVFTDDGRKCRVKDKMIISIYE